MYWTDWGNGVNAILRARMDGSFVSRIVQAGVMWPNGISLDRDANRLYWVDAWHDTLESSNINGLSRETILSNENQNLFHSFEVTVQGGHVYWTDWYKSALIRKGIEPGPFASEGPAILAALDERPYGFTVVDTSDPRPGGM